MVKSIQRIEQELAAIASQVDELKTTSCDRYRSYLQNLSQSVQRQLVTAAYQICTQAYPDEFLALSYTQRQTLQANLRDSGRQSESLLLDLIAEPALQPPQPSALPAQLLSKLPLTEEQLQLIREKLLQHRSETSESEAGESETSESETSEPETGEPSASQPPDPADSGSTLIPPSTLAAAEFEDVPPAEPRQEIVLPPLPELEAAPPELAVEGDRETDRDPSDTARELLPPPEPLPLDNPERLADWFQQVEAGIEDVLRAVSSQANRRLRSAAILSQALPAKLLDAALRAEESGSAMGNSPNLLNLLVEAERDGEGESKDTTAIQVTAVCLRLSEIEFADPSLMSERQQLRDLATKVGKLRKQYQKLQRERAIAAAEAAWRSSWSEG